VVHQVVVLLEQGHGAEREHVDARVPVAVGLGVGMMGKPLESDHQNQTCDLGGDPPQQQRLPASTK
jgi:ribulose bisphosphate carboxylase small subunit